jgi:hypothetical protein
MSSDRGGGVGEGVMKEFRGRSGYLLDIMKEENHQ